MKTRKYTSKQTTKHTTTSSKQFINEHQLDIVQRSVKRSGLTHSSFVKALTSTALGRLLFWNQADLERLLITAERLGLDPIGGDIYAIERKPSNTEPQSLDGSTTKYSQDHVLPNAETAANLQPNNPKGDSGSLTAPVILVLSVDGWSRIINSHAQFDGMSFHEPEAAPGELPVYCECTIYRKDRKVATTVREYMSEANTGASAWLTHPRRMLRHKAMTQCARICFGLGGIYEPDEADRIRNAITDRSQSLQKSAATHSEGIKSRQPKFQHGKPVGTFEVKSWLGHQGVKISGNERPSV